MEKKDNLQKEVVLSENQEELKSQDLVKENQKKEAELPDSKVLKERGKIFKKLYNNFFIIESPSFDTLGLFPSFEREVLYDNYQKLSFTRPSVFGERVYRETRPLYHSVSVKKREVKSKSEK